MRGAPTIADLARAACTIEEREEHGFVAASRAGARIVDPRASATGEIARFYEHHPHVGLVLPAIGYDDEQRAALRATIEGSAAELVVSATPIDLAAILRLAKPVVRVRYEYADAGEPTLDTIVDEFAARAVR